MTETNRKIDEREYDSPQFPNRGIPAVARVGITILAAAGRLVLCPGDDILAMTSASALGIVNNSDTPKEGVLPKNIEVDFDRNDEDLERNKIVV